MKNYTLPHIKERKLQMSLKQLASIFNTKSRTGQNVKKVVRSFDDSLSLGKTGGGVMIGLISILTSFLIVIILSSALSDDKKFENVIAQYIINEKLKESAHRSIEESIVVYQSNVEKEHVSPLKVWKYKQGNLVDAKIRDYEMAVGKDRTLWPPFTFVFKIKSSTSVSAVIEVATLYSMGIIPTSRGGNVEEWRLKMKSGNWTVIRKRHITNWD